MSTLHRYLLRQVLATCFLTVATFTALLLLGNVLKDVFDLLAAGRVDLAIAGKAVLLLIPFVLAFSLPIGLLTGSLLVFSRLSVDQELTAIRAGGISILSAITPVLGLSVVLTALSAWLNLFAAPDCRLAFRRLYDDVIRKGPASFIGEGRYVDLGNLTLYAREVKGRQLRDVLIYGTTNSMELDAQGLPKRLRNLDVWAPEAEILVGTNGYPEAIRLVNLQGLFLTADGWQSHFNAEHIEPIRTYRPAALAKPKLSLMKFSQLIEELELRKNAGGAIEPVRVQIHKQLAFSFSCIGFTLVGIPLGIRVQRRETNVGVAIALALMGLYYSFIILGQALDTRVHLHPHLIFWIPNFGFMIAGIWLLRRAERPA